MAQKKSTVKKPSNTKAAASKTQSGEKKVNQTSKKVKIALTVLPYVFGLLSLFLLFCYIFPQASGAIGEGIRYALFGLFGIASALIPVLLMLLAIFLKKLYETGKLFFKLAWGVLTLLFSAVMFGGFVLGNDTLSADGLFKASAAFAGGGSIGGLLAQLIDSGIGKVFTIIIAIIFAFIFACFTIDITPTRVTEFIGRKIKKTASDQVKKHNERKNAEKAPSDDDGYEKPETKKPAAADDGKTPSNTGKKPKTAYDFENEEPDIIPEKRDELSELLDEDEGVPQFVKTRAQRYFEDGVLVDDYEEPEKPAPETKKDAPEESDDEIEIIKETVGVKPEDLIKQEKPSAPQKPAYRLPSLRLLSQSDKSSAGISMEEARSNARKIVETLSNFGITVSVENISCGPTVTRYELKPAPGVRIAKIGNLIDDLARVLASSGVRFESSIEGKDTVGIEVPNKTPFTVNIRTLLETDTFKNNKSKVYCALGVDVSNEPVFLDIQKMPHMIIAGATGMGKSVCINSLIVSILYRATPDEVKLILVDPKKVEFTPYVGIPHLLVPVITDMKKAAGALNWLVQEMERRYDLIEATGCRNIFGYNAIAETNPEMEKLPVLVIIIDELADLMATSKDSVEGSIARIAAKARAAGMHLIIGTQRPDVSVISGTIKNNIPSRIACRVSSQIDSRTILDEVGAERLVGRGDMLYKPVGALRLTRLQGAFVSDGEVEAVATYVKEQVSETKYSDEAIKNIDKAAENIGDGSKKKLSLSGENGDDELLLSAIEISFDAGKVATSLLNRKLSIGYGRAAKIIDRMEEMGICSGANGSKPRELIMSKEQFMAQYGSNNEEEE